MSSKTGAVLASENRGHTGVFWENQGQALHTVTDGTSPAHVDANGDPRAWNGVPNPFSKSDMQAVKEHNAEEENPSDQQMSNAVTAAQQAFRDTYGEAAYQQAITPPQPAPGEKPK